MSINQKLVLNTNPERIFNVLTIAEEFSQMTGAPADIATHEGGVFSCFDAQIVGRHIELIQNKRIVQAWRVASWEEGVYSLVRFEIYASENATTIELNQAGHPADAAEHLEGGWHKMYWSPMKAYLDR